MRLLVLVVALALGGCTDPGGRAVVPPARPSPSPPARPAEPVVPDGALLAVGDLPGEGWRVVERSQGAVGVPEWAGWLGACPGHRETFPSRDQRVDVRSRLYEVQPGGGSQVLQTVELYRSGDRALADLRVLVDLCADYEFAGRDDPAFREQATVLPFDGLFVRLVRESSGGATTRYVAVARQADLVVSVEMTGLPETAARTVAARAVSRLGQG